MGKMGMNNRKTKDEKLKKENFEKIAKNLRLHLGKFKQISR